MLKKFTQEKLDEILEVGIKEFAKNGPERANMSRIAKEAGISVGVLYKYYKDKDDFFAACLTRSLSVLEGFLTEVFAEERKPLEYAKMLLEGAAGYAQKNADYVRMYHQITVTGDEKAAVLLADEVERMTSRLYTSVIRKEMEKGAFRQDMEPELFAFFFDNLMMMMQFSFCCPYYRERYRMYRGKDIHEEEVLLKEQLARFLESAFTFAREDVKHGQT